MTRRILLTGKINKLHSVPRRLRDFSKVLLHSLSAKLTNCENNKFMSEDQALFRAMRRVAQHAVLANRKTKVFAGSITFG